MASTRDSSIGGRKLPGWPFWAPRLRSLARRWARLPTLRPAPGPSEGGGLEELREFSRNCSCRSASLVSIWKSRWTSVSITSWQASSVTGFGASGCLPTGGASTAERVMASISMKNRRPSSHHHLTWRVPDDSSDDVITQGGEYVPRRAASMVTINSVSTRSSPIRFLKRVRLLGSMGASVCRYVSPQKYCQYGFSTQVLTTASSDASKVCCRYSTPTTRRAGNAGRLSGDVKKPPKVRSISGQSIRPPKNTSGWRMLISSSSREMDASLVAGMAGLGATGYSVEICKETNFCNAVHCRFCPRETQKFVTKSTAWNFFRADYIVDAG